MIRFDDQALPPQHEVPPVPRTRPPVAPIIGAAEVIKQFGYALDLVKAIKGEIDHQAPRAHSEICPVCQGRGCHGCDNKGWITVR